ncbi:MAG: hypothetical protein K6F56_01480 [Oscillospiraceae bacterium]|nr:hypothetical protein [Oscillospiraceae bacterium]
MEEQVKQLGQKQQKLKKARLITIIVAVLLIAFCVCIMFDVFDFKTSEEKPQTEEASPAEEVSPAEEASSATELPEGSTPPKKPGVDDLNGCSNQLYHPKPENYLDEYETAIARSGKKDTVALTYETKPWQHHNEIVVELENNTTVTVLARENSYSLVLVKEGLAGWLPTYELEKKQG